MTTINRQHTVPVIINSPDDKSANSLFPVPLTENFINEGTLQELLSVYPNLIPIDEIEPALGPLIFLGKEVPTNAGPLDLLYTSPNGHLTLVETKLWRNPEARRKVVGQLIDYAKEISGWSFEELDYAVSRANRSGNRAGSGVIEILNGSGHEIDEIHLIDRLTHNLKRGYFLLIVAGDGIREDVESMAEYLQGTPSLHFTLALLELALFRIKRTQNYPLLIQPRIVARTAEVVRAIVHVKYGSIAEVVLPGPSEEKDKTRRRSLTEDSFYEELALQTNEKTSELIRGLAEKLADLGVEPTYRSSSVSFRYSDPKETGQDFTIVIVKTNGQFCAGYLSRIKDAGYDFEIGLRYLKELSENTGARFNKKTGDSTYYQDVSYLIGWQDGFLTAVNNFIENIKEQA
jgi:hypothetical protein